jgi:hypothetical protein
MMKKSAAHANILCGSYKRVTVILSIIWHANLGVLN